MSLTNDSPEVAAAAAKTASFTLASLPASARNEALEAIHAALTASKDEILAANARDLELAQKAAADGMLSQALVSRLDLGKKGKFEDMLQGILDVRDLEDPGTWLILCIHRAMLHIFYFSVFICFAFGHLMDLVIMSENFTTDMIKLRNQIRLANTVIIATSGQSLTANQARRQPQS